MPQTPPDELALLSALTDGFGAMIFVTTEDRTDAFHYISPSVERLCGFSAQVFLTGEKSWTDLIFAEDRPSVLARRTLAAESGRVYITVYRILVHDGEVRWVEERTVRSSSKGMSLIGMIYDVTDRERMIQSLRENAVKYRQLMESAGEAILAADVETGIILEANQRACELFECERKDLIGKHQRALHPKKYWNEVEQLFRRDSMLPPGTSTQVLSWILNCKGVVVPVEISSSPVEVNGKKMLQGIFRDLRERIRLEDRRVAAEKKFKALVENSLIGIYVIQNDRFTYVNPEFSRMFGYTTEEVTALSSILTLVKLEDRELVATNIEKRMRNVVPSVKYSFRGIRKNGAEIVVEVHGTRVGHNGESMIMGTILDVTERIRSEVERRKLLQAVDQSQVSIVVTDTTGAIEYVNPKFCQVTGYTSQEVVGTNPRILKSGYTSNIDYSTMWKTITSGGTWKGEFHNKRKNGDLYWEDAVISPIRNADGAITHFVAVKEDITERKLLENQVFHAQRMESLGTLAGGIAHDLNNVLAPILLSLQAIQRRVTDPSLNALLGNAVKSALRGKEIVRQVLTFARTGEGEKEVVNVSSLLDELCQLMNDTLPKQIDLQVNCPQDLWNVLGDKTQIHQVLMNLCVNARDAMPKGGELRVTARNMNVDKSFAGMQLGAVEGPYICIQVSDTGVGIPEEKMSKIFDPFFTTKMAGSGTGLGLSTVHTIVKNHAGFIRVESKVKEGTTFTVYFPAQVSSKPADVREEVSAPAGQGETILVIDDEESILESAKAILEGNGYSVLTALDGTEAVTKYIMSAETIRLALIDLVMPYMDGVATARSLNKINSDLPIIASSGEILAPEKWEPVEGLIDGFLAKPYSADLLLQTVSSILRRHEENSQAKA